MDTTMRSVEKVLEGIAEIEEFSLVKLSVSFKLTDISTPLTVEIYEDMTSPANQRYQYRASHQIRPPGSPSASGHLSSHGYDMVETALSRAVFALTNEYKAGIKNGHKPSDEWLKKID